MRIEDRVLVGTGLLALAIVVSCQASGGPEGAAQTALEEYASSRGAAYKDVRLETLNNDGEFATVRITAKFEDTAQADWVEQVAEVQLRNLGGKWQVASGISFRSILAGDQDWAAVDELARASPDSQAVIMNIFAVSEGNIDSILTTRDRPDVLDVFVTPDRFNPDDRIDPYEQARAYGWTRALRKRFFSDGKFDEKGFYDYVTYTLGYAPSSVTQFLTKYEAFLKFKGIGISRRQ